MRSLDVTSIAAIRTRSLACSTAVRGTLSHSALKSQLDLLPQSSSSLPSYISTLPILPAVAIPWLQLKARPNEYRSEEMILDALYSVLESGEYIARIGWTEHIVQRTAFIKDQRKRQSGASSP